MFYRDVREGQKSVQTHSRYR